MMKKIMLGAIFAFTAGALLATDAQTTTATVQQPAAVNTQALTTKPIVPALVVPAQIVAVLNDALIELGTKPLQNDAAVAKALADVLNSKGIDDQVLLAFFSEKNSNMFIKRIARIINDVRIMQQTGCPQGKSAVYVAGKVADLIKEVSQPRKSLTKKQIIWIVVGIVSVVIATIIAIVVVIAIITAIVVDGGVLIGKKNKKKEKLEEYKVLEKNVYSNPFKLSGTLLDIADHQGANIIETKENIEKNKEGWVKVEAEDANPPGPDVKKERGLFDEYLEEGDFSVGSDDDKGEDVPGIK